MAAELLAVVVAVAFSLLLFIVLCVLCIICECNVDMLLLYDLHAVLELCGGGLGG